MIEYPKWLVIIWTIGGTVGVGYAICLILEAFVPRFRKKK